MIENYLIKLKKVIVAALTVALTVTVLQVNTNIIKAETQDIYTLKINGQTANGQVLDYGQYLDFELDGLTGNETKIDYFYGSSADFDNEAFNPISDGQIKLAPQSNAIYLGYEVTVDDSTVRHIAKDISVTIQKGTLATPAGLSWSGSSVNWSAVTTTNKGSQSLIQAGDVKNYTVRLYKDGALKDTQTINMVTYDFTSKIENLGKGVYTFDVKANSNSIYYNDSAASSISTGYIVPLVTLAKDDGIASVSPDTAFLMLPGNTSHNSKAISATAKTGFEFAEWTGSGVSFDNSENASTTMTINGNYSGSVDLTITATTSDSINPLIQDGSFGKNNDTSLKAIAIDNESGLAAYSFNTSASADGWTNITATNEQKTFTHTLTAGGNYYFHVKDKAGNSATAGPVEVTAVVYHNYNRDNSTNKTEYKIGNETYQLKNPTSIGYVFDGWYTDEGLNNKYTGPVTHNASHTLDLYAKWSESSLTITGPANVSKVYNGQNSALSVTVSSTANLSYQWHKVVGATDTEISGATSNTYNVKNVADSAEYYVRVTAKDQAGSVLKTQDSAKATVSITKAALTVKAEAKTIVYGLAAPTYTVSYEGLVNGETGSAVVTAGSISCAYAAGDAAGSYPIVVSGYTAANYEITHTNGTLTVNPKASDITAVFTNPTAEYTYSGNGIQPEVTVKCGAVTLEANTHYTVAYSNNINATTDESKAKVTVTMCGNYSGTFNLEFAIKKATYAPTVVLADWTYGDTASTPTLSTSDGSPTVTYVYAAKNSTEWSSEKPVNAGTYKVKATLSATANYNEITTAEKEFTIKKREITITANSATYKYDGTEHKDAGYSQTGTFATNQGFESVIVTGAQTIVGQSNNVVTYTLTSVTDKDNYTITAVNGILKVEEDNLTAPSNAKWTSDPGNISFVPVTKKNTVISTVVRLYHYDGETYTKIAEKTITAAECSLEDEIRADALAAAKNNKAYSYYFTLQSVPTGGADKEYYIKSDESDKIGTVHTGVISAVKGAYTDSIDFIQVDGVNEGTICLIEGESASIAVKTQDGYSLYWSCYRTNKEGIISVATDIMTLFSDSYKSNGTVKIGKLTESFYDGQIWAVTKDAAPVINAFTAANDPTTTYSKVVFSFNITDKGGVTKYMINTTETSPSADDPNWKDVPAANKNNFSSTEDIKAAGTYYIHAMDNSNNIVTMKTPITVYKVTLKPGEGEGDDIEMYKIENSEIALPANPYTKTGYGFQNWQGVTTGLHYDKGNYGENATDVLTALWTDVHYDYTVNYFYMNLSGEYETTADITKTFNAVYGTTVTTSTVVQEEKTGFTLDTTKSSEIILNDENKVLNVYYSRNKYNITYRFKSADNGAIKEYHPTTGEEFYYDADLSAAFAQKPSTDGFDFVGWDFGELGSQPATMPARNFTVTGEMVAKATTYKVRYYFQNLAADNRSIDANTYSLNTSMNQDDIQTTHEAKITVDSTVVPTVAGFTYSVAYASYGDVAGTTVKAGAAASIEALAQYGTENELYINVYYTRNTYDVTLNVLEITPTEQITEYTKTWKMPYGYAFADGEMTDYANYESSSWNHDDKYILASYIDYSTGSAPTTMPAGDVTITRQFVQQIAGEYLIEIYLETDKNNAYTLTKTCGYYGNVQDTVTVGYGSGFTIDYRNFDDTIGNMSYYDYKVIDQSEIDNGTVTGAVSGTITSGTVTDTNNGAEKLVLRIFFERKTKPITIHYYAKKLINEGTEYATYELGTVTKNLKWGTNTGTSRGDETESEYDLDPLKYFDGNVQFDNGKTYMGSTSYDFRNHNYVVSFEMDYGVYNSENKYYGNTKLDTVASLSETYYLGTSQHSNNRYVYYTEVNPTYQKYFDVMIRPCNRGTQPTGHETLADYQATYNYSGTDYKVRFANEAMFYTGATYVPAAGYASYPGLGYYNQNCLAPNETGTTGRYIYSTADNNVKEGFQKVTINSKTYFITTGDGEKYIYIPLTDNRLFAGNSVTISAAEVDSSIAYSSATQYLTDWKGVAANAEDYYIQGAYIYNHSWGRSLVQNNGQLVITYHLADTVYMQLTISGVVCSHGYAKGQGIKANSVSCSHGKFPDVVGYSIKWYKDAAFTTPLEDFTITTNTPVYGNYEKDIVKCYEYAYYELSNTVTKNSVEYSYITENEVKTGGAFANDPKLTSETSSTTEGDNTVETITYKYDGEVVMIRKDRYNEAFSNISMDKDSYVITGLTYDDSNKNNTIVSYVQAQEINLHAYYIRERHSLTVDPNYPGTNTETSEFKYGESTTLSEPSRNGYVFDGWTWYTGSGLSFSEWTENAPEENTVVMPKADVKAAAKWANATYKTDIMYYYQNTGLSYDKEAVVLMSSDYISLNDISITDPNGVEQTGTLYTNGGVSYTIVKSYEIVYEDDVPVQKPLETETYYYASGVELNGDEYIVEIEDLSAIRRNLKVTENDAHTNADYKMSVSDNYTYSYSLYTKLDGTVSEFSTDEATFSIEYGALLEYYYNLKTGLKITTVVKDTEKTTAPVTMSGEGTNYYYAQTVAVNASVPAGYDFVGWYKASDVLTDGNLKDSLDGITAVSTNSGFSTVVKADTDLVAVVSAKKPTQPTIVMEGISSLEYDYEAKTTNDIVAIATFPSTADSANYVKSYQWYKDGEIISGATANTYLIPVGWDAGTYKLTCKVTVGRSDNSLVAEYTSAEHTLAISGLGMTVGRRDYSAEYSGDYETFDLYVVSPTDDDDYQIYYSTEEKLTSENYNDSSISTTTKPTYKDVEYNQDGSVKTHTIYAYIKSNNPNYNDYDTTCKVTILPRQLTLSAGSESYSKIYDGTKVVQGTVSDEDSDLYKLVHNHQVYVINGIVSSEASVGYIINCSAEFNDRHLSKANSVTLTNMSLLYESNNTVNTNYAFEENYTLIISGSIERKPLDVSWGTNSFVYDGEEHSPDATITTTIPTADAANLSIVKTGAQKIVGNYQAVANLKAAEESDTEITDFYITNAAKDFSITKRAVTIKPNEVVYTYDAESHCLGEFTITSGTLVEGQEYTALPSASKTNAGTYEVYAANIVIKDKVTGADTTANYEVTPATSNLVINKKDVTVSGITVSDKTYDGTTAATANLSNLTFNGIEEGDTLSLNASKVTVAFGSAGAGEDKTVNITIAADALDGASKDNYNLVVASSQNSTTADIDKATITVTADVKTTTYGTLTTLGSTMTGFVNNEDSSVVSGSATYKISISGVTSSKVDYAQYTNAGTYTIHPDVSGLSADNYTFTPVTNTLTINKKDITVGAKTGAKASKTYDGTTAASVADKYEFAGILNNDSVTLTYTAAYDTANVSSNDPVHMTGLSINNANYNLTTTTFDIPGEITSKTLSITAKAKTITYGDAKPESFDVEYSGFENGETSSVLGGTLAFACDYDTSSAATRAATTYTITPSGLTSSNYTITFNPGTLTVNKATLTIYPTSTASATSSEQVDMRTAEAVKRTYGGEALPTINYVITGYKYAEDTDAVVTKPTSLSYSWPTTLTTKNDKISAPAGTYTLTVNNTGFSADNYNFTAANGSLTVEKRAVHITGVTVASKVYDGTTNVAADQILYTGSFSNLADMDSYTVQQAKDANLINITGEYVSDDVATDITVNLTMTLLGDLEARYFVTSDNNQKTATADITVRPVDVKADNKDVTYGSTTTPTYDVTYAAQTGVPKSGLVSGETATKANVTISNPYSNATTFTPVGTYNIVPSSFVNATGNTVNVANYDPNYVNGTLTVKKAYLAAPTNVQWSSTDLGKVTWTASASIGDVSVDHYELQLYRGTTAVGDPVTVAATDTLEKNYNALIHSTGEGVYTVKIKAVPSTTNNADYANVGESAQATSTNLYAAKVVVAAKTGDADSTNGFKSSTVNGTASYIMIAGENNIAITATLQNATGYTIEGVTASDSNLTIAGTTDASRTDDVYSSTVSLSASSTNSSTITIYVNLLARSATLSAGVTPRSGTGQPEASYGYAAADAPKFTVTAGVSASDNITTSDYTYTYKWEYKGGSTGTVETVNGTSTTNTDVLTVKQGLYANTSTTYYVVRCTVTATRKDNNKSITISNAGWSPKLDLVSNFTIKRADFKANTSMDGWTYGESRKAPSTEGVTDLDKLNTEGLSTIVYKYRVKGEGDDKWTTTFPTDAGTYQVFGAIPETTNYSSFNTTPVDFTIAKATLSTPTGLAMGASSTAAYGSLSWNSVSGYKENAGATGNSASEVTVTYEVKLYKYESGSWVLKKTYPAQAQTTLDVTADMQTYGVGEYKFSVQAISSNTNNVNSSSTAEFTTNFNIKAQLKVDTDAASDTKVTKSKTFNNVAYTLSSVAPSGATVTAYQWYKDGAAIEGATSQTYSVLNVAQTGNYTCRLTVGENSYAYTPIADITIQKCPVVMTSSSDTKVYNGTALTNSTVTAVTFPTDQGASYNVTGTITNVGTAQNTFTYTLNTGTLEGNYSISTVNGTLSVTQRSITNMPSVLIGYLNDVIFKGDYYKPEPNVNDTGLSIGTTELVKGTDFDYSYENNFHVGTATVTVTGKGNYSGTKSITFNIKKKQIQVNPILYETYYTGSEITHTAEQNYSVVGNDTVGFNGWHFSLVFSATGTAAGDYPYTKNADCVVKIGSDTGTDITNDVTLTYSSNKMVIKPTTDALKVSMNNSTYTYDGTAHANTNTPTVQGTSTTVTGTTTYTYSFEKDGTYVSDLSTLTKTAVGEYTIYIKASNPNYVNVGTGTAKLIINKREITVGMTGTKTYTGAEQSISNNFSVTSTQKLAADETATIAGKISGTAANSDGYTTITDKSITIKHGDTDVTSNYTVNWEGKLIINKADDNLVISMDDFSCVYDGAAHYSNKTPSVVGTTTTVTGTTTYTYCTSATGTYVSDLSTLTKTEAGTYTIYIKASNPNYNSEGTGTAELKIEKRKVKFIADSSSAEYDGNEHSIKTFTLSTEEGYYGLVSGHVSNVTCEAKGTQYSATAYAGTITAAADVTIKNSAGTSNFTANYDIETVAGTYTITKRSTSDMTVTFENGTFTYDGTAHNLSAASVSCSGVTILGTTTYTYKFANNESSATNDVTTLKQTLPAKNVAIVVTAHNDNFANDVSKTAYLTVNKRTVTFYSNGSENYDGTVKTLTLSNTALATGSLALVSGHTMTGTSTISGTNAGDYTTVTLGTMQILDGSSNNMTDYYVINMTGKLTINKSAMPGTVTASTKTYDGEGSAVNTTIPTGADYSKPAITYKKDGDTEFTSTVPTDVGSYTIKATWAETSNCLEASATNTFSINKRSISISGDSKTVEYNGETQSITTTKITSGSLASGDSYTATNTCSGAKVNVYPGTVSNVKIENSSKKDVTNNYNIGLGSGTLTITPAKNKNFAISLDDFTVTYDAADHYNENTASTTADITQLSDSVFSYKFEGDSSWKTSLTDLKKSQAGTYTIVVNATNPDFEGTATKNVTLKIEKRPLTVYTEGTEKYNGSTQTLNLVASDLSGGTTLATGESLSVTASISGKDVADYTTINSGATYKITKTADSSIDVTSNYDVTLSGKFSITKATAYLASITATGKTYDGQPIATPTVSTDGGDYSGYVIEYKVKGSSDTEYSETVPFTAGDYTTRVTYYETDNCVSISECTDFTISKRDVTFTGESDVTDYTGAEIELTGITDNSSESGKGLVNGDYLTDITYSAKGTEVGTYPGEFEGPAMIAHATNGSVTDNYNITTVPGSLTIQQSGTSWSVSLDNSTYVYDGTNHHNTNTPSNTAVTGTTSYTYSFDKDGTYVNDLSSLEKKNAGTYAIYVKATNPNYSEVAETTAYLIINKRPVDVTPNDLTKTYLSKDEPLTFVVESQGTDRGLLTGEKLTGLSIKRVAGEDANDYAITIEMPAESNENYNVNLKTGKYTIEPMDISGFSAVLVNKLIENGEEQTQTIKDVFSPVIADKTGYLDNAFNANDQIECDDYIVTGNKATDYGKYTLTITGQNNFKGSFQKTYIVGKDGKMQEIGKYLFTLDRSQELTGAILHNSEESLILSECTAEELAMAANGYTIWLNLDLTWEEKPDVTQELRDFMDEHADQFTNAYFVRIELTKYIYENGTVLIDTIPVHETEQMIKFTLDLPDEFRNENSAYERHYVLIREHNTVIEQLNGVYDEVDNTVTFESNRFSDYAVTYYDTLIPVNHNYPVVNTSVR